MYSQHPGPYGYAAAALKLLALIGSALLAMGWAFNIPVLVQHYGPFADVYLDSVISLVMLSLASVLPRRWRVISLVLTALVAVSAFLTLLGYTMRFSQPIDALLEQVGILSARSSANLHMPFPTALGVLLLCYALMIEQSHGTSALRNSFALASAVIGTLVMLQDLVSQLVASPGPDFAGTHDAALQSTVLIAILSAALALNAWLKLRPVGYRRLDHYYAWSTVLLVASFLLAWEYQERADWDQRAFETDVALGHVKREVVDQLGQLGQSQQRLASRWSIFDAQTQAMWERDANTVLQDSPGLYSIAYVDVNRILQWRVARDRMNKDFIGLKLDEDPVRKLAFDTVDRLKSMQMTETVHLASGESSRLFLTPLQTGASPAGYILASLNLQELPGLVPDEVTRDFNITIVDDSANAHGAALPIDDPGARVGKSTHIETLGQYWTIVVWPKESYLAAHRSLLLMPTLMFGGLMTVLAAAAFSQTRQSQISLRREGEAKTKLADTLDHITDGFVTLDRTWHITYANAQAAVITGRSLEEMIGSSALDLSANMDGIPRDKALAFAMEGKGTGQFTGALKEGRALDATAYSTNDGIAVLFRDVTEERARDEHLRLLETAVSRQNDVLIITDGTVVDGPGSQRIVYVNDAFTRLTGYSRDEALGQTPRILQGPATSRAELEKVRQAIAQKQPIQIEVVNYTKDRTPYWIEMHIAPIFDLRGTCTHFVAVERDITGRKQIEAQANYNLERFQHIFDVTNDIIWDADLTTGFVQYNENLQKILGYDPAARQLTTQDWSTWVHPEDRVRATKAIEDRMHTPMPPVDLEYRIQRANGSYAIMTDRAKIIRDAQGKPVRIVGTMSDVTERRAMAERLSQAQQLEAVGQLTGGVAHDFNNLLTVILGNSELLADRLEPQPKLKKLAEMTVKMALRGAELTSRLLAFARRQPLEPKRIDVNALVTSMEDWMRRTLPDSIRIRINGAPDLWQIEADPHQLENALLNLAVNARDAMPQGGLLTIDTVNCTLDQNDANRLPDARPGQYVRISVQDTGTGMDEATMSRAFEPFFTTKAMGKGSGLGLSMVYGFLRQSSGFAVIESTLGKGTTVHLYFPRVPEDIDNSVHPSDPEKIIGGTEHVLAVEDEENVLENVVAKLEGLGYRVSSASGGTAALAIIAKDPTIDLLFTDVVMPGDLSGPNLVKRAEAIRPGLKVLYTSGFTDDTIIHDGKVDAGLSLLSKPYRLADLAEKIRAVLDS